MKYNRLNQFKLVLRWFFLFMAYSACMYAHTMKPILIKASLVVKTNNVQLAFRSQSSIGVDHHWLSPDGQRFIIDFAPNMHLMRTASFHKPYDLLRAVQLCRGDYGTHRLYLQFSRPVKLSYTHHGKKCVCRFKALHPVKVIQPEKPAVIKKIHHTSHIVKKANNKTHTMEKVNHKLHRTVLKSQNLKLMKARKRSIIHIVIDPGHGGVDPGAVSYDKKVFEKTVALSIAKRLRELLNKKPNFKASLTRKDDSYLNLRQRLNIARHARADLLIAIHTDASNNPNLQGASVYVLSQRSRSVEANRWHWLSRIRRHIKLAGSIDLAEQDYLLSSILLDLSQNFTIAVGTQVGELILKQLKLVTHLHHEKLGFAGFIVLKAPDIPSILVETGFISNPKQSDQLSTPAYQQRIALALSRAIETYFNAKIDFNQRNHYVHSLSNKTTNSPNHGRRSH